MNFWKAFAPFEPGLWFALFVSLLVTVFLLWLFEGAKNDEFSRGGWGKRHRTVTRVRERRLERGLGGGDHSTSRKQVAGLEVVDASFP